MAGDGEDGASGGEVSENFDVIVLDLMLPKLDGLTVLQRLRSGGKDTHVLILTVLTLQPIPFINIDGMEVSSIP